MGQLSEKELSCLKDALSEEELLVKKYQMFAGEATDPEIKTKFTDISNKHQGHLDSLYEHLR
ncbi:MAG: spore coat protein [Velocimicrobium sp.]